MAMIASKKSSDRLRPRPLITLRATAAPRPRSWPSRASSFSGNAAPSQVRLRNTGPLPAKCLLVSLHPFQRPGCGRGGSAGGRGGLGYGGGFGRVLIRRSPAIAAARAPGRRRGRRGRASRRARLRHSTLDRNLRSSPGARKALGGLFGPRIDRAASSLPFEAARRRAAGPLLAIRERAPNLRAGTTVCNWLINNQRSVK